MMKINFPPINTWSNIFLDTSVFIDYFCATQEHWSGNNKTKKRRQLTQKLFDHWKVKDEKNRPALYFSVVSVSELILNTEKVPHEQIVRTFDPLEVNFIDYKLNDAIGLITNLRERLADNRVNEYIQNLSRIRNDKLPAASARQWVNDDMKIVSTTKDLNIEVVLTSDEKTFLPICDKFQLPCLLTSEIPGGLFENLDYDNAFSIDRN